MVEEVAELPKLKEYAIEFEKLMTSCVMWTAQLFDKSLEWALDCAYLPAWAKLGLADGAGPKLSADTPLQPWVSVVEP